MAFGGLVELLTALEVAALLKVTKFRAYALIRSGTIPSVRLGPNQIRVSGDALRAWVAQGGAVARVSR